jgi:hypothetical protein
MGYTLGQAAKAVGMSKTSILRSIKAGRISAGRNEFGQWAIEPCELHRVYPPLTDDTGTGNGTEERGVTGGEPALAEATTRATLAEARLSDFKSMLDDIREQRDGSATGGTAGGARGRGSAGNPHPALGRPNAPSPHLHLCFRVVSPVGRSLSLFVNRLLRARLRVTDPAACSATVTFEVDGPGPIHRTPYPARLGRALPLRGLALSGAALHLRGGRAFSRRAGTELTFPRGELKNG